MSLQMNILQANSPDLQILLKTTNGSNEILNQTNLFTKKVNFDNSNKLW